MHVFYKPGFHHNIINLDKSESYHCIKVLRMREQDEVQVINGTGNLYSSRIISANPDEVILEIISVFEDYGKRNYYLHIAIAPTKSTERFEYFIEKATEIGIDEITPLICHRSERIKLRYERLEKILLSAAKQSLSAYLPVINQAVRFNDLISKEIKQNRFIAYCSEKPEPHLLTVAKNSDNTLAIIGPEGDFTPEEISSALNHGCIPVSLGIRRLRTETAGVAVAQIIADSKIINK